VKIAMWSVLVMATGCGGAPPAAAPGGAGAAAAARPVLLGEMQKLAFYVGDWDCKATVFATEADPASTFEARVEVRPDAGGGVVLVRMIGPGDNRSAEIKGYDTVAKKWFHLWTVRSGEWGSLRSDGWDGDRLIATDDQPDGARARRTVFTRLSDHRYSHREEADTGQGFQPVWEKVCEKTGPGT
jgi:hypothetical protein